MKEINELENDGCVHRVYGRSRGYFENIIFEIERDGGLFADTEIEI